LREEAEYVSSRSFFCGLFLLRFSTGHSPQSLAGRAIHCIGWLSNGFAFFEGLYLFSGSRKELTNIFDGLEYAPVIGIKIKT
jgi:hypothetical protein